MVFMGISPLGEEERNEAKVDFRVELSTLWEIGTTRALLIDTTGEGIKLHGWRISTVHIISSTGGYYTIEQKRSNLRIIALNTNFMRHDPKYSQSHSSAVKQRPDGSIHYAGGISGHGYDRDHHMGLGKHYHRDYSNAGGPGGVIVGSPGGYPVYSDRRNSYSGGSSSIVDGSSSSSSSSSGGHVSALSGASSHESEKQWAWLENVLAQSSEHKKFVSSTDLMVVMCVIQILLMNYSN